MRNFIAKKSTCVQFMFIALVFTPLIVKGQTNFTEGLVVLSKGDTIKGLINHLDWDKNPKSILFKVNQGSPDQKFSVKEIKYFEVFSSDDQFQKSIVSVSKDNVNIDNTFKSRDFTPISEIDTVFLKILNSGNCISLFSYTDHLKTRFYLSSTGQPTNVYELVYRLHKVSDPMANDEERIGYIEGYKNQLISEAMKCQRSLNERIKNRIRTSKYSSGLIRIAMEINEQTNPPIFKHQKISFQEKRTRYFIGIGQASTTMNFTGDPNSHSDISHLPYLTLGLDNARIQRISKIHFLGEFILSGSKNTVTTIGVLNNFSLFTSSASILLKYYFNNGFVRIFIASGLRINLSYAKEENFHQNNWVFWQSIPVKAGVQLNHQIELSYCLTPIVGVAPIGSDLFNINSTQIGISYYFSKAKAK